MQGTFSSLTLGKRRWRCVMLCSPHKNFHIRNIFFLKVINVFLVVCWNDKNGTCKEQVPTKRERLKGWTRSFSREVGCCFKLRLWSRLSPSSLRDHSASTSWTMTQPFSRQPSPTIIYLQATIVNYQRRKERGKTTDLEFFLLLQVTLASCDVSPVAMFFYFTKQEIVEAVDTSNNTKEIRFEFRFIEQLPS